jgi:SAM-dependent methyltransferase
MQPSPIQVFFDSWSYQAPTVGYLRTFCPPPARVISIGCGIGLLDILLAGFGYQVTSIDSDPGVVESARVLSRELGLEREIDQADAFDLGAYHGRFDVAYSGGLLEHWNGTRTAELLSQHARCAPLVVVEVPTKHTMKLPEKLPEIYVDMKLFRPREFTARVRAAGLEVMKVYPVGSVPGRRREVLENLVPPALFRRLQLLAGYSMGIGVVARVPAAG